MSLSLPVYYCNKKYDSTPSPPFPTTIFSPPSVLCPHGAVIATEIIQFCLAPVQMRSHLETSAGQSSLCTLCSARSSVRAHFAFTSRFFQALSPARTRAQALSRATRGGVPSPQSEPPLRSCSFVNFPALGWLGARMSESYLGLRFASNFQPNTNASMTDLAPLSVESQGIASRYERHSLSNKFSKRPWTSPPTQLL